MIGDLDGFGLGDPSKHTEKQVDFHNLLRQRYRSPIRFPSRSKRGCSERRALSALCTNLNQKHEFFDRLALTNGKARISFLTLESRSNVFVCVDRAYRGQLHLGKASTTYKFNKPRLVLLTSCKYRNFPTQKNKIKNKKMEDGFMVAIFLLGIWVSRCCRVVQRGLSSR